ncbi:hypothetical protein [Phenylobacterium sp.]|uniref:hypothetical protein n=1 Tax=Phenylobacterium sp. TaxID=1871053 RepID=UPI00281257FC|nr:hypothetical protein [Phenylobacterium sp.]
MSTSRRRCRLLGFAAAVALVLAPGTGFAQALPDSEGGVAEWRDRTRVAREWLQGRHAESWAKRVKYRGEPIVLRFSAHNPADGSVVRDVFLPAFDVLHRMSAGKIVVQPTWGGATHSLEQGWTALARGETDMTACYASLEAKARGFELLTLLDLPGLFPNATVATIVSEKLYAEYFSGDFRRNGVRIARMKATGPSVIFTKAPLSGAEGLEGLRLFSAEGVQAEAVRALGGDPVVMETPRIRAAIADGKLEGAAITEAAAAVYRINTAAPHMFAGDVGRTNFEYCLSPTFLASLPRDLKPILNAWLRAQGIAEAQVFYGLNGAVAREEFRAAGGKVIPPTPAAAAEWRRRVSPVEANAVARMEAKGLPARRFMADLRRLTDRYNRMSENDIMMEAIRRPIPRMDD